MSGPKQAQGNAFTVTIVACGPISEGKSLVYLVTVTQPVQSWAVVRSQDDFQNLGKTLSSVLNGVPSCPLLPVSLVSLDSCDINVLVKARNDVQNWLSAILVFPGAHESLAVSDFLTTAANSVPAQYENVVWTQFGPVIPPDQASSSPIQSSLHASHINVDDMDMDDMFIVEDEAGLAEEEQDDYDEDFIPSASVRYKPTNEQVTDEDEMELAQLADEVEMVDDIGYLAQSLGASHLGRSLQLQAEIKHKEMKGNEVYRPQKGLDINTLGPHPSPAIGGIGSAMERAAHFNHNPPVSAPRLDSFKMIKVIGKGSFGKVFLVKEHKTGNIYALKVLRKDNIIKRNQVEHTNTERSVLGYVKHPFIVGMNMAFQSKEKLYFVLDYCAGGELFFHLGKLGKFPEPRARFYAAEIVLAISYVHSLGIIYRDLKPENVLLDAQGHIRLTDFGLSKEGISNSSSGAYSFCGTPEYLAPEILNRQGHGRAVDWWSLGALLYEMITGLPPFYCQDREKLFEKIRKSELHYPPSVSRQAKRLLVGLLNKNPTKRSGSGPTDAEEIKKMDFFADLNFEKLMKGEIPPPWKPEINGSLDTSQFDKEFTKMPIFSPQSLQRTNLLVETPNNNPFEGFTYQGREFHGPQTQAKT